MISGEAWMYVGIIGVSCLVVYLKAFIFVGAVFFLLAMGEDSLFWKAQYEPPMASVLGSLVLAIVTGFSGSVDGVIYGFLIGAFMD